jgi:hypothetical protein
MRVVQSVPVKTVDNDIRARTVFGKALLIWRFNLAGIRIAD